MYLYTYYQILNRTPKNSKELNIDKVILNHLLIVNLIHRQLLIEFASKTNLLSFINQIC